MPSWVLRILRLPGHALFMLGFALWEWSYVLWNRPALLPALWRSWEWSLFHSPYSRRRPSSGEFTYGEIALPTVDKILTLLNANTNDCMVDLGSGRGRVVLLAACRGIPAEGIELLNNLVKGAQYAQGNDFPLARFHENNFLDADLQHATILWVAGTCWTSETHARILEKILALPPGTRVISITRPLQHPRLPVQTVVQGWTSWGRDSYHIQWLKPAPSP